MNINQPSPTTENAKNVAIALHKRRIDPILQEVYDIKAQLNAEAGYSVEKILERARQNALLHAGKH